MPILIRPAVPDDVPALLQLVEPFVAERKLLPRTADEMRSLVKYGFTAEDAGKVVGFAAVEIYSSKMAEVQCLAVSAEYQGQGIGRQLVQRCVDCAREHRVWELMAITSSEKFLKDCGFDYSLPDQKRALFIRTRET